MGSGSSSSKSSDCADELFGNQQYVCVTGVVVAFIAYVLVVAFRFRADAERRRMLTYAGLGVSMLAIGLITIVQGRLAAGLLVLAVAGIELGLLALIRATRPSP